MHFFLAGHILGHRRVVNAQIRNYLASYAYPDYIEHFTSVATRPYRLLIDSGAFSVWNKGRVFSVDDYAHWLHDHIPQWQQGGDVRYFNLDVIGDQSASWHNQQRLESRGLSPIPIFTYGADFAHWHRALDNYEYVALGGLVPFATERKKLWAWLDKCFAVVVRRFKDTGVMPRVHILGIGTQASLFRYPCYSADSSSWLSAIRHGRTTTDLPAIPRASQGGRDVELYVLRREIENAARVQNEATKLWTQRGVTWN